MTTQKKARTPTLEDATKSFVQSREYEEQVYTARARFDAMMAIIMNWKRKK